MKNSRAKIRRHLDITILYTMESELFVVVDSELRMILTSFARKKNLYQTNEEFSRHYVHYYTC